jgi:nicotinamidase-related amidase
MTAESRTAGDGAETSDRPAARHRDPVVERAEGDGSPGEARRLLRTTLRRRTLRLDEGRRVWTACEEEAELAAVRVALVICDMWDRHWSLGASRRVDELAPRIDAFANRLRDGGVLVVHAPSDTIEAYAGQPARERIAGRRATGDPRPVVLGPLPIDDGDGGSDTIDPLPAGSKAWSRQHPLIAIDQDRDVITDDGRELVAFLGANGRDVVLMTGVHTNMCVLNRSFGLRALVGWGISAVLVSDLTDAMYNPERPPYVSHEEGTALVVQFVESFVAPTTRSADVAIVASPPR